MDATSNTTSGERLRGQLLLLRGRSGLTQRALAALLGISEHAIYKWEAGEGYPSPARLQALIAVYVERGVFPPGREQAEARALWAELQREAGGRIPPFDDAWFATLQPAGEAAEDVSPGVVAEAAAPPDRLAGPTADWGEAPDVAVFQGRAVELDTLRRWLGEERCRVVNLLGLGGIGKTALATRLAQDLAGHYEGLCWRSVRNALPPEEWLAMASAALAPEPPALPHGLSARLALLLELLRARRCLLVLDNLETVLEPHVTSPRYQAGYEGYGEVLRQLGESRHQSCLLLTSREAPPELTVLAGEAGPVRTLRLGGLDLGVARTLLADKGLAGDDAAWEALVGRYGGSPLALRVVGQSIAELFGGEIAPFLAYVTESYGAEFGGIRLLLDAQVARLAPLGRSVLYWLAIEREPVGVARLAADLGPGVRSGALLEALADLGRRALLERGVQGGTHTLQPVVLEYATERLVAGVCQEISAGAPLLLCSHALVQATAKDYVRRSQERLIAAPLLEQVRASLGSAEAVERRLRAVLEGWRGRPAQEQGYGPGNVVNLLRLLRGDLRGLDLSGLAIRQAYLAEVEAQDASLAGAHLAEAVLAEAFDLPSAVSLSADGTLLATGTLAGEVWLWRVADRTLLLAVPGHSGIVMGVALGTDGQLLASGSFDGTVKLWEVPSGRLLASLHGHTGRVLGVALSTDGRLLASASLDGTVRLWEVPGGNLLTTLPGHNRGGTGVALSGDGRLLVSGGYDGTVRLWETPGGRLLATLQGHTGSVIHVALSQDGQLVASGSHDGTIRLWEAPSGRPLAVLEGHRGGVRGVALSGDGGLLASGDWDGTLRLWEAASGRVLATMQGHGGMVHDMALSGDGGLLASVGEDETVKLWETRPGDRRAGAGSAGRLVAVLKGHSSAVAAVALSADGRLVASGSHDGTVRLWETGSGRLLSTLQGHSGAIWGVALSADGRLLASGSQDRTARLWEAPSGRLLAILQGHAGGIRDVVLSADGHIMASASEDQTAKLWSTPLAGPLAGDAPARVGQPALVLATLQGHTATVTAVALSEDGRLVATGSEDGAVMLWEAASGELLAALPGHTGGVRHIAFSGNGRLVATCSFDQTVRLWEAPTGRLLATLDGHTDSVNGVALSAEGGLLASGSSDGTVKLWAVAHGDRGQESGGPAPNPEDARRAGSGAMGRLLATLQGHTGPISDVALSADGRLLASGSFDGTTMVWDARSGACVQRLRADRRYARLDITGLTGVTAAQRWALLALGAVEHCT